MIDEKFEERMLSAGRMVGEDQLSSIIEWIQEWFDKNGPGCNAIVGISGGKDSAIVAALCCAALGKNRVIGIKMPNGNQEDIEDANKIINYLGIRSYEVNIGNICNTIYAEVENNLPKASEQTIINVPPRIRMTILYAFAQSLNGRVANTCNASETFVGYETLYGDAAGDFAPLKNYTYVEVLGIGSALGLPEDIVYKTPADGLTDKSDEENLGVSYYEIDAVICNITDMDDCPVTQETLEKIDELNTKSQFKRNILHIPGPSMFS